MIRIALDGTSGAGKSTLAKALAKKLGIVYLDTGALYRTVGLAVRNAGLTPDNVTAIENLLPQIKIDVCLQDGTQEVYLNGSAVGDSIRTPEISKYASAVSAIPAVRAYLLDTQKQFARDNSVIMDGRDIGTVIMPDADVKFYVSVRAEVRAARRCEELREKGIETDVQTVLAEMLARDHADSTRTVAPAVKAADAIELDNSDSLEKTIAFALDVIERRTKERH